MPARCCPECFDDRGLRKSIFPFLGPSHGKCNFCGTEDVDLVEPRQLATYFELLANVYELSGDGKSLVEWMKEDWALFSHPSMDVAHAKELLERFGMMVDIVRRPFAPSSSYSSDGLIQWERLRDEMMYKNRWFLDVSVDTERLKALLVHLPADNLPQRWYRARLISGEEVYSIDRMGAPPKRLVSHGRANPAGIPYLYLGSSRKPLLRRCARTPARLLVLPISRLLPLCVRSICATHVSWFCRSFSGTRGILDSFGRIFLSWNGWVRS